jgi:TRAP-type C4-dicarboxylate transport system permease small subunit
MHRTIRLLAHATAVLGGIVLTGLVVLTTVSIVGRSISKFLHFDGVQGFLGGLGQRLIDTGVGEVRGSYELLEAGIAFAIFSFFPVCQLHGAHATVDIFTARLSARSNRVIAAFWEVVLSACLILISWRLFEGMQRYIGNGETTLFLQFPVWWAYLASFSASVVTCIVAVYCAALRVRESVTGRTLMPQA